MRLARTFWNEERAKKVAAWLRLKQIQFELQAHPTENPSSWRLWILDENELQPVKTWLDELDAGKINLDELVDSLPESIPLELPLNPKATSFIASKNTKRSRSPLTFLLIFIIIALHLELTIFLPPSQSVRWQSLLLFDGPLQSKAPLDTTWPGLYPLFIKKCKEKFSHRQDEKISKQHPLSSYTLFQSIRSYEIWRLVTPSLLHGNWLHLLFSVLWLHMLGKLIEMKAGTYKLAFLVLFSSIISNVAQYLMTGFLFLGFSGVLMAMVGFVYARCRHFPWEGYQLSKQTFTFIGFYLILTLCLQLGEFILSVRSMAAISLGIANSSHLMGLLSGYLLGRMHLMRSDS